MRCGTHRVADPVCPSNLRNRYVDALIISFCHRIDQRTEELLGEIEWPAQAQLPQLVTRFLDRHR